MNPEDKNENQKTGEETLGQEEQNSQGTTGIASSALAATPAGRLGRVTGFIKGHKKGMSGGVIATIITIFVVIFVGGIGSTQLIWMNSIMQGFHYGPYNRNVVRQADRTIRAYQNTNNTKLSQKMQTTQQDSRQAKRVANTRTSNVSKLNRRGVHRVTIGNKINTARGFSKPPFRWRIFSGRAAGNSWTSPRLLLKGVSDQTGNRKPTNIGFRSDINRTIEQMESADKTQRKSIARGFARGVGTTAATAAATLICLSAAYDDILPDDKELYELFLTYAGTFNAAGAQLAAGEDVHDDEINDAMQAYYETMEVGGEEEVEYRGVEKNEEGNDELEESGTTVVEKDDREVVNIDFSQSAAWKRATNLPVDGNEEDYGIDHSLDSIMDVHNGLRSFGEGANFLTGGNATAVCIASSALSLPLLALEIKATMVSGGGWQAARRLVTHGAMTVMIVNMVEGLTSGSYMPDTPAMQMGLTGAGMSTTQSELARSQGGVPISSDETNARRAQHFELLAEEDRDKGFAWRYLSPDNPRSALTNFAMTANFSLGGMFKSLANIPKKLPGLVANALSSRTYADDDFDNYDLGLFDMSEKQMSDDMDILDNADVVEGWFDDIDTKTPYSCVSGATDEEAEGSLEGFVDLSGNPCNADRWEKSLAMQIIVSKCMSLPYYEMEDNEWRFSMSDGPLSDTVDCSNPSSNHLDIWERVGLYKMSHDIVDSTNCLSHDMPCNLGESFFEGMIIHAN
ncbi:MAG: hypothetical protein WD061_03040 [Candidatus Saccharimonadales bacterium]